MSSLSLGALSILSDLNLNLTNSTVLFISASNDSCEATF